jgi:hypothetical protein
VWCLINVFTNKLNWGILNTLCPARLRPRFA